MSQYAVLNAVARSGVGKGAARAARRAGTVPAVIYGAKLPPVTIALPFNELLKTLNRGKFYTTVFTVQAGGESYKVLPKAIQKNKLNGLPEHVDFLRLVEGSMIEVKTPVKFVGQDLCPGIKAGGSLNVVRHEVELRVPPESISEIITIDVSTLNIGDSVHVSAVKLPTGAKSVIHDRDFTIATIAPPSAESRAEAAAEAAAAAAALADAKGKGGKAAAKPAAAKPAAAPAKK